MNSHLSLFNCDQAALRTLLSVRLSVRPSVRLSVTHFSQSSSHHIIMEFSGVITNGRSDVHAKGQGQRWEVKVTEVTTQFNRFRTVTPGWIHIWWWNDAQSLMLLRRGALLFFRVIRQFSQSRGKRKSSILTQIWCFWTATPGWIHIWLQHDAQSLKQHRRGVILFFNVIRQISRSHGTKKSPIFTRIENFRTVFFMSSIKFHVNTGWKINDLNPIWVKLQG